MSRRNKRSCGTAVRSVNAQESTVQICLAKMTLKVIVTSAITHELSCVPIHVARLPEATVTFVTRE